MFQYRFGKIDKCFWWDLEGISADSGTQFTPTEFQDEFQTHGVHLVLAAPEHHEMNGKLKIQWRMLRTIAHSFMVHARVSESYIHFELMYTADHISGYTNQRPDKQKRKSNRAI